MEKSSYPKDVINEQPAQQDTTSADSVQLQKFYTIYSKCQPKQIIGYPVLNKLFYISITDIFFKSISIIKYITNFHSCLWEEQCDSFFDITRPRLQLGYMILHRSFTPHQVRFRPRPSSLTSIVNLRGWSRNRIL